jgi:hypothetical protein
MTAIVVHVTRIFFVNGKSATPAKAEPRYTNTLDSRCYGNVYEICFHS